MYQEKYRKQGIHSLSLTGGLIMAMIFICLLGWLGCKQPAGGSSKAVKELEENQKKILTRLDLLEKRLAGPKRPQVDYDKVYDINISGSYFNGPKDAKATLVEFSDFQCPYSKRVKPLVKDLLAAFPKDLKHVYMNFPLGFHKRAEPAARASLAAGNQGKYWEMQELLFENSKKLEDEDLKGYAEKIGLNVQQFEDDYKSEKTAKLVKDDIAEARRVQVTGTPTLFLNGKRVKNRSVDAIKKDIEGILKQSK